jgi:hypothetical protein
MPQDNDHKKSSVSSLSLDMKGGQNSREQGNLSNLGSLATLLIPNHHRREASQGVWNQYQVESRCQVRSRNGWKTDLSAIRYRGPSFSNSANTQSVIVGIPTENNADRRVSFLFLFPMRLVLLSICRSVGPCLGLTLRHQTIHHPLDQLDLVLERKVDKVCIYQYAIRRS